MTPDVMSEKWSQATDQNDKADQRTAPAEDQAVRFDAARVGTRVSTPRRRGYEEIEADQLGANALVVEQYDDTHAEH
jgi:hypothetical protein